MRAQFLLQQPPYDWFALTYGSEPSYLKQNITAMLYLVDVSAGD